MRRLLTVLALAAACAAVFTPGAFAARGVQYGIQDDAWLAQGPGTLEQRLDTLQRLGVDVVRFSIHWNVVAPRRPARALSANDPAYRWQVTDPVLRGLASRGIQPLVTLYGTPGWANGRSRPNVAPKSASSFADFAYAAAKRYPFVRRWTIWNEPNQRAMFSAASPSLYVTRLLNPAYAAIHRANRRALVAGGVTAARGNTGGVSPLTWIAGMKAAHAKLDAYAHHPYPTRPTTESPFRGACASCGTITMANLPRLLAAVRQSFGPKQVWLTEYGYQTNPPDRWLGVRPALQARYIGEGALRAYQSPQVTLLIQFLVKDEPVLARWQSGLFNVRGAAKPAARAFPFPLAQVTRNGSRVVLWGQVRPRRGAQPYRLQVRTGGAWRWLGGMTRTNGLGFFSRAIVAPKGAQVRIWSPRDRAYSWALALG
jgi:Glycosyl hydrolase family 1